MQPSTPPRSPNRPRRSVTFCGERLPPTSSRQPDRRSLLWDASGTDDRFEDQAAIFVTVTTRNTDDREDAVENLHVLRKLQVATGPVPNLAMTTLAPSNTLHVYWAFAELSTRYSGSRHDELKRFLKFETRKKMLTLRATIVHRSMLRPAQTLVDTLALCLPNYDDIRFVRAYRGSILHLEQIRTPYQQPPSTVGFQLMAVLSRTELIEMQRQLDQLITYISRISPNYSPISLFHFAEILRGARSTTNRSLTPGMKRVVLPGNTVHRLTLVGLFPKNSPLYELTLSQLLPLRRNLNKKYPNSVIVSHKCVERF